jgi:uncharacterized protein YjbJ (UPF0337 family)
MHQEAKMSWDSIEGDMEQFNGVNEQLGMLTDDQLELVVGACDQDFGNIEIDEDETDF